MKYKIVNEFVLNGIQQKAGNIVNLDAKIAGLKSIQANIEKVPETTPLTGAAVNESVMASIKPGEQLTAEQKEKLSKENAAATAEAFRMADEANSREVAEGRAKPAVNQVADLLKAKLEAEEFVKKEVS